MNNEIPFKVECIYTGNNCLTVGKEYNVVEIEEVFYKVKNDSGVLEWYHDGRFEIVETSVANPKDKQELSVGDKVVINKITDYYVSYVDDNVKVGDVATVTMIENYGDDDIFLTNPNWKRGRWFSKADVSFVDGDNSLDYHLLSPQEVVQATLDGKEVEMQYKTGTWVSVIPMNTTLHQLANLTFRLKPSLEGKRKAIIKKLLENKVAVLCKCWDDDDNGEEIVAITTVADDYTYPYINSNGGYKNAFAIDDSGNEITNV